MKNPAPTKIFFAGGLNGICTALSFILAHDALTTDHNFSLWEFGIAMGTPALISVLIAKITKVRVIMLLTVGYLTLLIPILGASFGASGSEPLWQFAALGLVGGLVWSTPFVIWSYLRNRKVG